jgi:hypothetical protein
MSFHRPVNDDPRRDWNKMTKAIAITLNVLMLITFFYLLTTQGAPKGNDIYLVALVFSTPIMNLIALTLDRENWLGLYFKRKALEEKKKIEKMESSDR